MAGVFFDPAPPGAQQKAGFDDDAQYQMVPSGGTRIVGLRIPADEPRDVVVFVDDQSAARITGFIPIKGPRPINAAGGIVFSAGSEAGLTIEGGGPGPALVVVEQVTTGVKRHSLKLGVKAKRSLTYQVGVLSDQVHVPNFEKRGPELAAQMVGAEQIWLRAANIELTRVGPIVHVRTPGNLGDRIIIDDPGNMLKIILTSMVTEGMVPDANIYVFSTWDIVYQNKVDPAGSTAGFLCFVETGLGARGGELVAAHEIGHALGLPHIPSTDQNLLMTSLGINGDRLAAGHIEFCNPSP